MKFIHLLLRIADFAEELTFGTVVFVKEGFGGIAARAGAVIGDVTFRTSGDRADLFAVTFFVVRDEIPVSSVLLEISDQREFINLELLVFWGVGVIKSPLLKRNISTDKIN